MSAPAGDESLDLPSPCLVVLVGPPGAGKSTWAQRALPGHVVSSDGLRSLVGEGEHDLRASADAFALLDDVVRRRVARRLTTVIDALGTDPDLRARWRGLAAAAGVPSVAVVFDVPAAQVRRQNRARAAPVPEGVLREQLARWPSVVEAVRAEPFGAVHVLHDPSGGAALVAPSMVRSRSRAAVTPAEPTEPALLPPRPVRFGVQVPRVAWAGAPATTAATLRAVARAADACGLDSLWVMDHMRQIPSMGPPWEDVLESWTTLGHLAACTERIGLGTLVTGITYRNVAHLGKIVATLDVLSGGRATCGLGLAWYADEHRAYGWPFPDRAARYDLLEDALELLPVLWGPGNRAFSGRVLRVPDTTCYPRPLQARIPILVGGGGERRTLRLVARYADACNLFGEPDVVARKVGVLRRHCAEAGRDPAEVSVTHLGTVLVAQRGADLRAVVDATRPPRVSAERHARAVGAGTLEHHVERIERLVAAGVDHVIVSLADLAGPAEVERWAAVVAAWRALRPAAASGPG